MWIQTKFTKQKLIIFTEWKQKEITPHGIIVIGKYRNNSRNIFETEFKGKFIKMPKPLFIHTKRIQKWIENIKKKYSYPNCSWK